MAARWARYSAVCSIAPESASRVPARPGVVGIAQCLGPTQRAVAGVVAGLFGLFVAFDGRRILLPGEMGLGQVVVGHGPAVGLFQDLDRPVVPAQEVQSYTQPHPAGRRMVLPILQFAHRVAEDGVLREVAADGLLHLPHFAGTKSIVCQDDVLQIELYGLRHQNDSY